MLDAEYNLRSILHIFFRRKFIFLLAFLVIFVPGLLYAFSIEPYYESKSSILLKFGQNARPEVNLSSNAAYPVSGWNESSEILQSNVQILQSADLVKKVLEVLKPETVYPDLIEGNSEVEKMQKAIERAQSSLDIVPGMDNNLIEIHFTNAKAQTAADFSTELIEQYKTRHTEIYDTPQVNFLEEQVRVAEQKLQESQDRFRAFKKEMGISEIDQEIEQLLKQKNELSVVAYQSVTQAQETLSVMEAKEAEMRATYRSSSPVLKSLRDSIAVSRAQLRKRQNELSKMNVAEGNNTDSKQTSTIDERITWLEQQRGNYNELERKISLDEENVQYYRQRMEEARVNTMLNSQDITRIAVVDKPSLPLNIAGPKLKLIIIGLFLFGMFVALITTLFFEIIDDRFSLPDQVRKKLGLPLLATFEKV